MIFIAACGEGTGGNNGGESNDESSTFSSDKDVFVVFDVEEQDGPTGDVVRFQEMENEKIQFCYAEDGCVVPDSEKMIGTADESVIRAAEPDMEVVGVIVEGTVLSSENEDLEADVNVVEGEVDRSDDFGTDFEVDSVIQSEGPFVHEDEVSFEVGETE